MKKKNKSIIRSEIRKQLALGNMIKITGQNNINFATPAVYKNTDLDFGQNVKKKVRTNRDCPSFLYCLKTGGSVFFLEFSKVC